VVKACRWKPFDQSSEKKLMRILTVIKGLTEALTRVSIALPVFLLAAAFVTPPDVISQIVATFEMAIVFGLLTLTVSWFKSFKQAPENTKKMIIVLVCLLSITIVSSIQLLLRVEQFEYADSADPPKTAAH